MYRGNKTKFNLPKDAPAYMKDWANKLHSEFLDISRSTSGEGGTTVIISGAGATTSSSSSSTTTTNVKSGTQSVTAGAASYVPFPTTFTTTPYVTLCFIAQTDGGFGSINTQNLSISTSGFTIPAEDILVSGTIFYIATHN